MSHLGQHSDLLTEAYADTSVYAKSFFQEAFSRPFDKLHYDLFEIIDNREELAKEQNTNPQMCAVAVPRGLGKSTILNVVLGSKSIVYHEKHNIMPVSHTSSQALQESENLKTQLMENDSLRTVFEIEKGDPWNQEKWVVRSDGWEACIYPRGSGQSLRGARYRHWRPDLIIVDDLEDPDNLLSEEQRDKQKEWFFGSLINCVDRGSDDWLILVLGTIMHPNSLLCRLLANRNWTSYELAIADPDLTVSNVPNFKTIEQIHALRQEFEDEDKLDTFYREYMNQPAPTGKDAMVKQEWFQRYSEDELKLSKNSELESFLIVDPARTTNPKSADSAVLGVGFLPSEQRIYLRALRSERMHVPELYDEIFIMCMLLNTNIVGIETTGLKEHITYPLMNEAIRRGFPIQIVELSARAGGNTDEKAKVRRFRPMMAFYKNGLILHNKAISARVEGDVISFPSPKKWDILDTIAYIPQMLEIGGRYMQLNNVGEESELEGLSNWERAEREYDELEYEAPLNWEEGFIQSPFQETLWDGYFV